MIRSRRSFLLLAVVLGAAWLAIPPPAYAIFQVEISSNGATSTYYDLDGDGSIYISGAMINGYTITGTLATSNASSGGEGALLDLIALIVSRRDGTGGPLTIRAADTGFTFPGPPNPLALHSILDARFGPFPFTGGGGSVSFQSFVDGTPAPVISGSGGSSDPVSGATQILFNRGSGGTAPYSLTSVLTITLNDEASLNFASAKTIVGVPETPTWLSASIAVGVLGVGNWWRRRRAVV